MRRCILFSLIALATLLTSFAGADEFYKGAFLIEEEEVVLDDYYILTIRERHPIDKKVERELRNIFVGSGNHDMRLKPNWWDRGTHRFDEHESIRHTESFRSESALPARFIEKIYGGRVDVGDAKVYTEKFDLPSLKFWGNLRISVKVGRFTGLAFRTPW